ncbi:MAG: hypothetical protein MJ220_00490 [Bacilli bacterium]|nr:hypothetical protein [Bacilli bacterium]
MIYANLTQQIIDIWNAFVDILSHLDWKLIVVLLILVALLGLIISLIVGQTLGRRGDRTFEKDVKHASFTARIIRVNMKEKLVTFFNMYTMRKVRNVRLDDYISSFAMSDQQAVRDWFEAIIENRNTGQYLEAGVIFKKEKKSFPSFLKLYKVDYNLGIIHLESHLIRYSASEQNKEIPLASISDFGEELAKNGTERGMTFCFTLAPKSSNNDPIDIDKFRNNLSVEVVSRFKKILSNFSKGKNKLIQVSANEFVICNFDMMERTQAISFALKVINKLNRDMNDSRKKKKNEPLYEVRCGVVENKEVPGGSNEIISSAKYISNSQFSTMTSLGFYEKDDESSQPFDDTEECKTEISKIVKNKKFSDVFRPVFSIKNRATRGYLTKTIPVNTPFDSIDDMKNYAARAKESLTLFSAIVKDSCGRFIAERGNDEALEIYLPTTVAEIPSIIKAMPKMKKAKEANLFFLFREADIFSVISKDGMDDVYRKFDDLRNKGYRITLTLEDKNLLLNDRLYSLSDAFFVDFSDTGSEQTGTRIRSKISAVVDKLVKFGRPIVASNLSTWLAIEMVVGAGIEYISSDAFASYDDNLKPISKKSLDKLYGISERK